jgi:nucleoside-diphosphate-sugar epimerase
VSGAVDESFPRGAGRGYGNLKAAKELLLEAYADLHKFELVMLRPANVYGAGHFWSGSSGGAKMQALLEAGLDGRKARIPVAETMANEYVYARDMGRAVDLALTAADVGPGVFNIGNGVVSAFEDVVAAVRGQCPGLEYEIEPGPPPKSKTAPLSIEAARQHLGWAPQYDLAAGFADFAQDLVALRRPRDSE